MTQDGLADSPNPGLMDGIPLEFSEGSGPAVQLDELPAAPVPSRVRDSVRDRGVDKMVLSESDVRVTPI